jgi:hypothetical protein
VNFGPPSSFIEKSTTGSTTSPQCIFCARILEARALGADHMMDMTPSGKSNDMICGLCRYPGSDLRLVGCGCCVHAVSQFSAIIVGKS